MFVVCHVLNAVNDAIRLEFVQLNAFLLMFLSPARETFVYILTDFDRFVDD